jgi:plastocyanin
MEQEANRESWNFHNRTRRMVMRKIMFIAVLLLIGGAVTARASVTTVIQSHTSFDKPEVTVRVGDTVVFVNQDVVTHNIQIVNENNSIDDKGLQRPGGKVETIISTPGEYKVRCSIHPKMRMKLVVQ